MTFLARLTTSLRLLYDEAMSGSRPDEPPYKSALIDVAHAIMPALFGLAGERFGVGIWTATGLTLMIGVAKQRRDIQRGELRWSAGIDAGAMGAGLGAYLADLTLAEGVGVAFGCAALGLIARAWWRAGP